LPAEEDIRRARRLLSGELGGPWALRAARFGACLQAWFDWTRPLSGWEQPLRGTQGPVPVADPVRLRREASAGALPVLETLRRPTRDGLLRQLDEQVWVFVPGQEPECVPREQLVAALLTLPPSPLFRCDDLRSYTPGDLLTVTHRPVRDALFSMMGADQGVSVCFRIQLDEATYQAFIVLRPVEDGSWRLQNLPFPAFDDAYRASAPASLSEEPSVRAASEFCRHLCLGNATQLRTLADQLTPEICIDGTWIPNHSSLLAVAEKRAMRVDEEIVTLGATPQTEDLAAFLEEDVAIAFKSGLRRMFNPKFEELQPQLIRFAYRRIASSTRATEPNNGLLRVLTIEQDVRQPTGLYEKRRFVCGFFGLNDLL
jgi:hypothetical protein